MDLSILSHQQSIVNVMSFAFGPRRTTSSGNIGDQNGSWDLFVASLAQIWEQNGRTCASNACAGDKVNSWMIAIHIIQIPRTGWTWLFLDLLNALREWPTACAASTNATWRCCKQRHARVFAILVRDQKGPIPNGLICWATFKLFLNTLPFNLSHHINKLLSSCQHEPPVSIPRVKACDLHRVVGSKVHKEPQDLPEL